MNHPQARVGQRAKNCGFLLDQGIPRSEIFNMSIVNVEQNCQVWLHHFGERLNLTRVTGANFEYPSWRLLPCIG